jgi:hypothetical protein
LVSEVRVLFVQGKHKRGHCVSKPPEPTDKKFSASSGHYNAIPLHSLNIQSFLHFFTSSDAQKVKSVQKNLKLCCMQETTTTFNRLIGTSELFKKALTFREVTMLE